jgi:hypothetical protein
VVLCICSFYLFVDFVLKREKASNYYSSFQIIQMEQATTAEGATPAPASTGGWRNPLHAAVWMNDYAGLDELLARALRGAPSIGPDFESAEMMATSSSSSLSSSGSGGGLEAVYLEEEEHGLTALYAAVLRGDERAAEALLAKGAMPENGGCRGVPPLFSAAARGNADLVRTTTP